MIGISLVEFKSEKIRSKRVNNSIYEESGMSNYVGYLSPISLNKNNDQSEIKQQINDVTKEVLNNGIFLRSKYTIIYLYDFMKDNVSFDFIKNYGGKLHNMSSLNVTIMTYFESYMVNRWSNVHFKDEIRIGNNNNKKIFSIIEEVKQTFEVQNMPAMIIIQKGANGDHYFNIELSGFTQLDIYNLFNDVINIINENCDCQFKDIAKKISGKKSPVKNKTIKLQRMNTFDFIKDLVDREKKLTGGTYNLEFLANRMGFDRKTLVNKRNGNSFTRDECFFIAFEFGISLIELNELLRLNWHPKISEDPRDQLIEKCLYEGLDISEVNDKLMDENFETIHYKMI